MICYSLWLVVFIKRLDSATNMAGDKVYPGNVTNLKSIDLKLIQVEDHTC